MKNRIKVYRAMHDLTQEVLAERLGVTRQTIIAIERGKYNPSLELAFKMARIFGVTIEDLFEYEDREPGTGIDIPFPAKQAPQ
ncbi:MAG: putative transcriptional regulator [Methanofollis sp.]|nr:putative transcriptional regulator [Methanofollis sp.]